MVILCVGIGMGIGRNMQCKSSYDNSTDYEAFHEDYVDNDKRDSSMVNLPGDKVQG